MSKLKRLYLFSIIIGIIGALYSIIELKDTITTIIITFFTVIFIYLNDERIY